MENPKEEPKDVVLGYIDNLDLEYLRNKLIETMGEGIPKKYFETTDLGDIDKENCCTPIGQIKRYVDCIGCDKKPKQETLEEAAKEYDRKSTRWGAKNIFIDGAKWNERRMYSEEEVESLLHRFMQSQHPDWHGYSTTKWFEQFKNK
jgi:hypothetical protein